MDALGDQRAIEAMIEQASLDFSNCDDAAQLAQVKARYLGRDGRLTAMMKSLAGLQGQARSDAGKALNAAKQAVESEWKSRENAC